MEYDKLELIEHKAEKLLQDLKKDSNTSSYTNALYIMIILSLACIGYLYIYNIGNILVNIIVLVLALLAYRLIVSNAAKDVESTTQYKNLVTSDKPTYVKGILKYLAANINLQLSRMKALRTVYMLMFPFLLLMLRQIFIGAIPKSSYILNLFIAIILGSVYWFFFFKKDIDNREQDYWEVVNLSKKIKS